MKRKGQLSSASDSKEERVEESLSSVSDSERRKGKGWKGRIKNGRSRMLQPLKFESE